MKRPYFLGLIALAVLLLALWLRQQPLDLEALRTGLSRFEEARAARPFLFAGLFLAAYVAVAALSLPLAVWMTLPAGALFGFWWGLLNVSFASTIGPVPVDCTHVPEPSETPPGLRPLGPPPAVRPHLIVIGAGAAGLVSAYIAAATQAKVALIEAHNMGGDCLN